MNISKARLNVNFTYNGEKLILAKKVDGKIFKSKDDGFFTKNLSLDCEVIVPNLEPENLKINIENQFNSFIDSLTVESMILNYNNKEYISIGVTYKDEKFIGYFVRYIFEISFWMFNGPKQIDHEKIKKEFIDNLNIELKSVTYKISDLIKKIDN